MASPESTTDEQLCIKPGTGPCDVHDWPTKGLARRLIQSMRERHGKGGVNACTDCIHRAIKEVASMRGT